MDVGKVAAWTAIYLIVGLLTWLEVKTRNDISIKTEGHKRWREPGFFRIIFLWPPAYFLGWFPKKWGLNNWLYK